MRRCAGVPRGFQRRNSKNGTETVVRVNFPFVQEENPKASQAKSRAIPHNSRQIQIADFADVISDMSGNRQTTYGTKARQPLCGVVQNCYEFSGTKMPEKTLKQNPMALFISTLNPNQISCRPVSPIPLPAVPSASGLFRGKALSRPLRFPCSAARAALPLSRCRRARTARGRPRVS